MGELELSFLHYLITERPPAALLKSYRNELCLNDKRVTKVVDFICENVPDNNVVPTYLTLSSMLANDKDAIDTLAESISKESQAPDMSDYSLLLFKEDVENKQRTVFKSLKTAIESNDFDKARLYAEELATLSRQGRMRVGPLDTSEFFDIDAILKPEEYLTSHIPRLNQHLGGYPEGIDFEDRGGFTLGEITIISGSTNKGKSCLATSIWNHFITQSLENPNYRSVYINYEGAYERFRKSFFAAITGYYPYDPKSQTYTAASKEYLNFLQPRKDNFLLYDGAGRKEMPDSTSSLEIEISKMAEKGYRAFFIDTINSIDNRDGKEGWQITESAMRMLERIAKRYEIAIIASAQNKQGLEFEDQKWPDLKWIGQSQTLQQKPGAAIGIYRADLYSGGAVDYTTLAIIKCRHRSPYSREGVNVSYDKRRRMLVPYNGSVTNINDVSEATMRRQALNCLRDDIEVAYAEV